MSERMTILVTGSRKWTDYGLVLRTLAAFRKACPVIVHGGARGADAQCDQAARVLGYAVDPHPIPRDWWQRYGNAAGPIRNKTMLEETAPDLVIAFRAPGVSNGTDDMIRRALAAGTPCWVVTDFERAMEDQ